MSAVSDEQEDKLLSVNEAAEMLQISAYTLREWARDGKVPVIRLGRFWRFWRSSLTVWLHEHERVAR